MIPTSFLIIATFTALVTPSLCFPQDSTEGEGVIEMITQQEAQVPTDNDTLSGDEKKPTGKSLLDCECVAYNLCNLEIPDDDDVDFRDVSKEHLSKCGPFHVCCPSINIKIPTTPIPEPWTDKPDEPTPHSCGVRNMKGLANRIVNDNLNDDDTKLGEFPWQVAVMKIVEGALLFVGGGALIHPNYVVTAPHIFKGVSAEELIVRVGEYDLQYTREELSHQDLKVKEIIIHENINYKTGYNDIALLYMEPGAKLAANVLPICLPNEDEEFEDGLRCTVTGWGKDKFVAGTYSSVMKIVNLPIVERNRCQDQLRLTRLGSKFDLHNKFLCAGGEEGFDACKGDGGGPLSCLKDNFYKLAGIVVWGVECGMKDVPGVYIDVAKFTSWIDFQIQRKTPGESIDVMFRGQGAFNTTTTAKPK